MGLADLPHCKQQYPCMGVSVQMVRTAAWLLVVKLGKSFFSLGRMQLYSLEDLETFAESSGRKEVHDGTITY